eukprot:SAG22_NODE_1457_length_4381_cov_6.147828_2_plen_112_part_00
MPARQTLQQTRTMMGENPAYATGIGAGMADMAITTPREGVKDIDSCDINDPLAVVEYLPEIYDHLRQYEVSCRYSCSQSCCGRTPAARVGTPQPRRCCLCGVLNSCSLSSQ